MLVLFCEFFRRYQNNIQLNFYRGRSSQHFDAAQRTSRIASVGAVISFLGAGGLGFLGVYLDKMWSLAALGAIGTAVSLYASRREELNMDVRNSERYDRTWHALKEIDGNHDDVVLAIVNGNVRLLIPYVKAIHEQLSLEHRQWLGDGENIRSSMQTLKELLSKNAIMEG